MKKKLKKKIPLIIISALVLLVGIFSVTWICYYQWIWMPHVNDATVKLEKSKDDITGETIYSIKDEFGDTYYISIPRFGSFDCHVATYSTYVLDEAKPSTDESGNITFESYVQNGSAFGGTMLASFTMKGTIEEYKFDIGPYPELDDDEMYAQSAFLRVSPDGSLLNEDELSKKEYAIYKDSYSEIMKFIQTTNRIFCISRN